ncbi:MAG: phosphotransferase enzyme family protein [Micavibrio sp.]|nr:phosphotransferase enzyme family protein [Micavibrio sp.]
MPQPVSKIVSNPKDWFDARVSLRDAFLQKNGLGQAKLALIGSDMASRRYFRLQKDAGQSVLLMESVPDLSPLATPGHRLSDFIRLSAYLRNIGIPTPQVFEADEAEGYLLLEDFGDVSFKAALEQGMAGREALYETATDILIWLRQNAKADDIVLPDYYQSHVHTGRRRLIDWYVPAARGQTNPDGLVEGYLDVWDRIEKSLPPVPEGFLHIDFHFENLMYPKGVLDFQGAMKGPVPYDLANLLEDARMDVPTDLRDRMIERYCQSMSVIEKKNFLDWYRVLATQFHCRVMGQFIRLAVAGGKPRYLEMIPRVAGYVREGLKDPVLKPLADWFDAQKIDFAKVDGFDANVIRPNIRPDAF